MPDTRAILIVDDSEDDVVILMRSIKIVQVENPVHCVDTAERAICYLKGEGEFSDRQKFPMAFLVLLDMKLFSQSGLEVLRWVRAQPKMHNVIVVAMTSAENPGFMDQAYRMGANSFLIKPFGTEATTRMIKGVYDYWVGLNRT